MASLVRVTAQTKNLSIVFLPASSFTETYGSVFPQRQAKRKGGGVQGAKRRPSATTISNKCKAIVFFWARQRSGPQATKDIATPKLFKIVKYMEVYFAKGRRSAKAAAQRSGPQATKDIATPKQLKIN